MKSFILILIGILVGFTIAVVWACIIISGDISRVEERKEIEELIKQEKMGS